MDSIINLDEESDDVEEVPTKQPFCESGSYDDIFSENKLIGELIEKCLELAGSSDSSGMKRVIDRSIIPAYKRTTQAFRESDVFRRVVTLALCNLEKFPHLKFSHLKELCESLKCNTRQTKSFKVQNTGMYLIFT